MVDSNLKSIMLLAALITGIGLIVISIIGLSVVGQVAYFILAVIDDSLWTPQYKYVDGVGTNITETAQYTAAKAQLDDDLTNITLALQTAAIVIGLIGLVIVILVFFMKGGILDMIKGTRTASE